MKTTLRVLLFTLLAGAIAFAQVGLGGQQIAQQAAASGGEFFASAYAAWRVQSTNSVSAGSNTMALNNCFPQMGNTNKITSGFFLSGPAGFPQVIIIDGSNTETVTITGVTAPSLNSPSSVNAYNCGFTATFANAHTAGVAITSGDAGLVEAADDLLNTYPNGGVVNLDGAWPGTNSMITSAAPSPLYTIQDERGPQIQFWNIAPSATTFIATPATLTATTVGFGLNGANTTGGAYTGGSTYHVCVAYVDAAGNEGACSADFSGLTAGSGSTNQIGFAAPAASTGAVGYTVYISLAGGTYALAYQVPLTSSVCTLTKVETVTPACAVTNATYGQTGSNAIVSALTVNTSPLALQLGGANNQLGTGNSGAHTTYAFAPSSHPSLGIASVNLPFTATAGGASSTNPVVMATLPVPAGFMNYVGHTIRLCAKMKQTLANSPTIENWQVYWDGAGSDTAGSPVQLANIQGTATFTNVAYNGSFCENFTTTVSGAGATAGSIIGGSNVASMGIASAPTNLVTMLDTLNAAVASLNLAGGSGFTSRLHIVTNHTTGADGASQVLGVTVEVLN